MLHDLCEKFFTRVGKFFSWEKVLEALKNYKLFLSYLAKEFPDFWQKKNKHQIGLYVWFYDGIINGGKSMSAICRDKKKRNCFTDWTISRQSL